MDGAYQLWLSKVALWLQGVLVDGATLEQLDGPDLKKLYFAGYHPKRVAEAICEEVLDMKSELERADLNAEQ